MHPQTVLAHVRALQSRRTLRDSTRRFWIEGLRQFIWACDAGLTIDTIVHSRILLKSSDVRRRIERVESTGAKRVNVSPELFRSISITERASGVGAIVRQHWTSLNRLDPRAGGLCWLVIESIRSAGNLGTILRTAEASGAAGVIFLGNAADPFDPRVVRASMGGIFHLKLARMDANELRRWSATHGVRLIGLAPRGPRLWTDVPIDRPTALLLGEERQGLTPAAAALCDTTVRLPMPGRADSLNVAVAAGIMMYEFVRRAGIMNA
jgi:TrmH family RNA methyltransferase